MNYIFSATDNAFYPLSMRQQYTDAGPAPAGKIRGVVNEMPAWVDLPPPTPRQLIDQAEQKKETLRATADKEIVWRQDAVDAGIAKEEETVALSEWKKYRVLLMRVDASKPVWPTPPGK